MNPFYFDSFNAEGTPLGFDDTAVKEYFRCAVQRLNNLTPIGVMQQTTNKTMNEWKIGVVKSKEQNTKGSQVEFIIDGCYCTVFMPTFDVRAGEMWAVKLENNTAQHPPRYARALEYHRLEEAPPEPATAEQRLAKVLDIAQRGSIAPSRRLEMVIRVCQTGSALV